MLDHVSLGVRDIVRGRQFYDAPLRPLGLTRIVDFGNDRGSDYGSASASSSPTSRNWKLRLLAHIRDLINLRRPVCGSGFRGYPLSLPNGRVAAAIVAAVHT